MGANTKLLRSRIKSVDSTLHLTKAMGLVASSKIRKATNAMLRGREYAQAVSNIVRSLVSNQDCQTSPYMMKRSSVRTKLIVIAGDRGLAGGYNANIFRTVRDYYQDAEIIPIGKRVCDRFSYARNSEEAFTLAQNSAEAFSHEDSLKLATELCSEFVSGEYDRLGILGTKYVSMMTQLPEVKWLLPLASDAGESSDGMIFEPNAVTVLNAAIPEYVAGMLTAAVRESFACEVAARRMAMDSAGKNAQQMIDSLQLQYNRARQGTITQEITEIVAGSGQ